MDKKKVTSAADDFRCANAGCPVNRPGQGQLAVHGVWRGVVLRRRCQKQHWDARDGNHKADCKPAPKPEAAAAAAARHRHRGGAGRDNGGAEPAHPCPICLVNEDDHGACGQCTECGRLYCGECNEPETLGRVDSCPT